MHVYVSCMKCVCMHVPMCTCMGARGQGPVLLSFSLYSCETGSLADLWSLCKKAGNPLGTMAGQECRKLFPQGGLSNALESKDMEGTALAGPRDLCGKGKGLGGTYLLLFS